MLENTIGFNSLTMNDRSKLGLDASPYYYIPVTSVDGFWGNEVRYESHVLPGDDGERSADALMAGKQLVLAGGIEALNLRILRVAQRAMEAAFRDLDAHNLTFQLWGEVQLYYICKVNQPLAMTDVIERADRFTMKWTVGLRADNPRSFKVSDNTAYPYS